MQVKLLRQPFIALTNIFAPGSLVVTSAEIKSGLKVFVYTCRWCKTFFSFVRQSALQNPDKAFPKSQCLPLHLVEPGHTILHLGKSCFLLDILQASGREVMQPVN